ncbi:MAG: OmpA family protein [Cryobacterium sp.]|nr:OmpA family protein [Oligoflexia bacterium]
MKFLFRKSILAASLICTPLILVDVCENAIARDTQEARENGYLRDAETTKANGGVGNYLFRYSKDPVKTVSAVDEFSYSSQSSAVRGDDKTDEKLYFKRDSSDLSDNGRGKIETLATELKNAPSKTVNVEGYADATGTEGYNQGLSERRAQAVVHELRNRGVSTAQLRWQGKGVQDPIGNNETEAGRTKNRRVEITE